MPCRASAGTSGPRIFAMPKSSTLTWSGCSRLASTMTFSGFKSRWMTSLTCASPSAEQTCAMMLQSRSSASGQSSRRTSRRSLPCTCSITMYRVPSFSRRPKSSTWMTLGWFRRLAAFASRSKRPTRVGSSSNCGLSILRTTVRSSARCWARYTLPIPPWPMRSSTRNRPDTTVPTSGSATGGCEGRKPGSVAPRTSGAPQYTHRRLAAAGRARWQRGQDFGNAPSPGPGRDTRIAA